MLKSDALYICLKTYSISVSPKHAEQGDHDDFGVTRCF